MHAPDSVTVAIVMPLGKISPWFDPAVKSALDQDMPVPIRLVANALSESELAKLRILESSHPRIKLHVFSERVSMVENWNRLLEVTEEDFLCVLHDDDILETWTVRSLMNAQQRHPGLGIYHGIERIIDENGAFHHGEELSVTESAEVLDQDHILKWAVSNRIWATGFIMNKNAAMACGGYNMRSQFGPDWDLYFLVAARHGACFVNAHVGRYRLGKGTGQVSASYAVDALNLVECDLQQDHNLRALGKDPRDFIQLKTQGLADAARATLFYFGVSMSNEGKKRCFGKISEGVVYSRLGLLHKLLGYRIALAVSRGLIWLKYPSLRKL